MRGTREMKDMGQREMRETREIEGVRELTGIRERGDEMREMR